MSIDNNDIPIFNIKLVSGDDLIAMINHMDHENKIVKVEFPVLLSSVWDEEGESYAFKTWLPLSSKGLVVPLPMHAVMTMVAIDDKYKQTYIQYFLDSTEDERISPYESSTDDELTTSSEDIPDTLH